GDALAAGARLAGEAAALDADVHVQLVTHLRKVERTDDHCAVLIFREEIVQLAAVDLDLAAAVAEAHPRHRGLAPAGAEVILLFRRCFRHGLSPYKGRTNCPSVPRI